MIEYYKNLSKREQLVLNFGVIMISIVLVWAFVWLPLSEKKVNLESKVSGLESTVEWLLNVENEVLLLKGSSSSSRQPRNGKSILALIDKSSRDHDLESAIKRIEPSKQDGVRVWMEQVGYDKFIKWSQDLQKRYAIRIEEISVDRGQTAGQVNLRVHFKDPQS